MPDSFAETIATSLRAHVGALVDQQQILAAQPDYTEESCRLNRGLHELETVLKLLEARARRAA